MLNVNFGLNWPGDSGKYQKCKKKVNWTERQIDTEKN